MRSLSTYLFLTFLALLMAMPSGYTQIQNNSNNSQQNTEVESEKKEERNAKSKALESLDDAVPASAGIDALSGQSAAQWYMQFQTIRKKNLIPGTNDLSAEGKKQLKELVDLAENSISSSFEYHLMVYLQGEHNPALFPHLKKAFEMRPKDPVVVRQMIAYYEITGNKELRKSMSVLAYSSGIYRPGSWEYGYNLLQSSERNSILVCYGESDAYPAIIQQDAGGHRSDVFILYFDLLETNIDYRNKVYAQLGLSAMPDPLGNKGSFLDKLGKQSGRPVYISAGIPSTYLKQISGQLYPCGNTFRYSLKPFQNKVLLAQNWEKKFRKDELLKSISGGSEEARLNLNYLPGLLILEKHYLENGQSSEATQTRKLIEKIAKEGKKEKQLEKADKAD